MKRYVIFDFDGTLINTNDVIIASWEATYEHFLGYRPPLSVILSTFGETLEYTISQRFSDFDLSTVLEYDRNYQSKHRAEMVTLFKGTEEMLEELTRRGYKLAIATSRMSDSFHEYILFGVVFTSCCARKVSAQNIIFNRIPKTNHLCLGCSFFIKKEDIRIFISFRLNYNIFLAMHCLTCYTVNENGSVK